MTRSSRHPGDKSSDVELSSELRRAFLGGGDANTQRAAAWQRHGRCDVRIRACKLATSGAAFAALNLEQSSEPQLVQQLAQRRMQRLRQVARLDLPAGAGCVPLRPPAGAEAQREGLHLPVNLLAQRRIQLRLPSVRVVEAGLGEQRLGRGFIPRVTPAGGAGISVPPWAGDAHQQACAPIASHRILLAANLGRRLLVALRFGGAFCLALLLVGLCLRPTVDETKQLFHGAAVLAPQSALDERHARASVKECLCRGGAGAHTCCCSLLIGAAVPEAAASRRFRPCSSFSRFALSLFSSRSRGIPSTLFRGSSFSSSVGRSPSHRLSAQGRCAALTEGTHLSGHLAAGTPRESPRQTCLR